MVVGETALAQIIYILGDMFLGKTFGEFKTFPRALSSW